MRRRSAFTLIELLTAITVFSIVIAVISTVYVFFIREQRNVATVRKVYAEARDLMDRFTVSIKEGVPDYSVYTGAAFVSSLADVTPCSSTGFSALNGRVATSILVLLDSLQTTRTIYCLDSEGVLYAGSGAVSEFFTLTPLSSSNLSFDRLEFLITPLADPSDPNNVNENGVQYQPAVTVSTQISATSPQSSFVLPFTTTFSSRVYTR